jgi:hypothetical protein
MPLVSTLPKKGESAKVYDVPEAELAKYQAVEAKQTSYDEGKDRLGEGEEIAGSIDIDKSDVQAVQQHLHLLDSPRTSLVLPLPVLLAELSVEKAYCECALDDEFVRAFAIIDRTGFSHR